VVKRSLPEMIGTSTPATSLSENVNLFQSLRVLQEGEADTELFQNSTSISRSGKTDVYVENDFIIRGTFCPSSAKLSCNQSCNPGAQLITCKHSVVS